MGISWFKKIGRKDSFRIFDKGIIDDVGVSLLVRILESRFSISRYVVEGDRIK